uniref:Inosine/uridine-preferring nucleoside hydrolase domain-containing protein n=1 Tax=Clastoptera arizonana TaxID=38151 RepID=A0A1B6CZ87_9HEMI
MIQMLSVRVTHLTSALDVGSLALLSVTLTVVLIATAAQTANRIIIDTDAGIDDAAAIFLALTDNSVQVDAITCVMGNTYIENVVVNVLKVLKISNQENIPVYAGTNYGLMHNLNASDFFGNDGLGDVYFPNPPSVDKKQKGHAAVQMVKLVKENPGIITVICLGPLTNLAIAINIEPNFLSLVKKVVILGGAIRGMGNQSPGVEFNFFYDPDAASLVLQRASLFSNTVTILGLEPINDAKFNWTWRWDVMGKLNTKIVKFLNQIELAHDKMYPNRKVYTPYDSGAVAVALYPEVVMDSRDLFVTIDPFGQAARGAMLIDYYNVTSKRANVNLITEINGSVLLQRIFNNFAHYTKKKCL